jgi:protein-S-isoprenylcysteine O-methyltransferase Ste14
VGLLFHKLVWEILKKQSPAQASAPLPNRFELKTILKAGKVMALILLVIQTLFLNILPISSNPFGITIFGIMIYLSGLLIAVVGRMQLGKNWANLEDYQVLPGQALVRSGIYHYIRHPIYIGDVLLVLGLELALNSWLVVGVTGLLVVVIKQALAEEMILSKTLPGYNDYRRQTKMFIPFLV